MSPAARKPGGGPVLRKVARTGPCAPVRQDGAPASVERTWALREFVRHWHVVVVAGCNLRCAYCSSNYGTYGGPGGVMDMKTAAKLADRIVENMDPERRDVQVSCNGGETFLHFDRFIAIADLITAVCRKRGGRVKFHVSTNGVLLDEARLRKLARRKVGVVFSIDGPENVHDGARRTTDGRGSFREALAHWKRYCKLRGPHDSPFDCGVNSVYGPHTDSLRSVVDFWLRQGLPRPKVLPTGFSRFNSVAERAVTKKTQERFYSELREYALEQARTYTAMNFLSDYRGLALVFDGWQRLLTGRDLTGAKVCNLGGRQFAVDHDGALYPCLAYVGVAGWKVGDLFAGVDPKRMAVCVDQCAKASTFCAGCEDQAICQRPCPAIIATRTPLQNMSQNCGMARRMANILSESFNVLMQNKG